jgi:hypothetical protein
VIAVISVCDCGTDSLLTSLGIGPTILCHFGFTLAILCPNRWQKGK